jgi:acyl carrier protein
VSPTFERVREVAADVLQLRPDRINPQTSPQQVESWDSVQHLTLVLALEQAFEVELTPEEIEGMHSIEGIVAVLEAKLGSGD